MFVDNSTSLIEEETQLKNAKNFKHIKCSDSSNSACVQSALLIFCIVQFCQLGTQRTELVRKNEVRFHSDVVLGFCLHSYKAQKKDDGTIECVGINLYNSEPCNTKNPPPCKCSGDDVNSIVIDDKGTWCSSTPKTGSESKLWPCENKEEWIAYKSAIEQEKQ
ncbi:hypothetical protein Trydic_g4282 [Trypoxylus dichotomus]